MRLAIAILGFVILMVGSQSTSIAQPRPIPPAPDPAPKPDPLPPAPLPPPKAAVAGSKKGQLCLRPRKTVRALI